MTAFEENALRAVLDNLTVGSIQQLDDTEIDHSAEKVTEKIGANKMGGLPALNPTQVSIILSFTELSYYSIVVIAGIGILLNLFVVGRLWKISKAQPDLKPACILLVMSSMDILSLVFVLTNTLVEGISSEAKEKWLSDWLSEDLFCKVTLYMVYLGSSFGLVAEIVWAWISLSGQRFVCIVCPVFTHKHGNWVKSSARQLLILVVFCAGQQIWIFVTTEHMPNQGCTEAKQVIWQDDYEYWLWLDTCLVFLIPAAATLLMELKLRRFMDTQGSLSTRPNTNVNMSQTMAGTLDQNSESCSNTNPNHTTSTNNNKVSFPTHKDSSNSLEAPNTSEPPIVPDCAMPQAQTMRQCSDDPSILNAKRLRRNVQMCRRLRRYLFLTSFDLALNLPYVLIKLVYGIEDAKTPSSFTIQCILTSVAMILYYGQYSLNLLYIWVLYNSRVTRSTTTEHTLVPRSRSYRTGTLDTQTVVVRPKQTAVTNAYHKVSGTIKLTKFEQQLAEQYLQGLEQEEDSGSQVFL